MTGPDFAAQARDAFDRIAETVCPRCGVAGVCRCFSADDPVKVEPRRSGEGSVKGAKNNWPACTSPNCACDFQPGSTCRARLPTGSACRYPGATTCRCHEKMGNDFWFLPADRCLWDDEPLAKDPDQGYTNLQMIAVCGAAVILLCCASVIGAIAAVVFWKAVFG